jgi:hypothetical protein
VDIIANHTFVSLDSVSLSALGQENPESAESLWKPAKDFLDQAQAQKRRLAQEELRVQQGLPRTLPFRHEVFDTEDLAKAQLPKLTESGVEFPTILLSHVPLYRAEGTPCGPLREHWPPTPPPKGQTEPLEKDERNAIAVRGGYQYQNVLHREITKDIAEKVGKIQYAFSGDDHDYCEVVHRGYASAGTGIKEITVKSISLAMGVRKPGVVLVSLWNPVDEQGNALKKDPATPTLQTHLCLLPDQLGIFLFYAKLVGITIVLLAIRAALVMTGRITPASHLADTPLLPTTAGSSAENEKAERASKQPASHAATSSNSSSTSDKGHLQVRNQNARTRSTSPGNNYALPSAQSQYTYPLVQHAGYYGGSDDEKEVKSWGTTATRRTKSKKKGAALFFRELRNEFLFISMIVFVWYFCLIWRG